MLMTKDSELALTSKQAKLCLGFCKMTVCDEANMYQNYEKLQFVELLEMIGRIADVIFFETDLEYEKLHTKIENVLDTVLKMVGC